MKNLILISLLLPTLAFANNSQIACMAEAVYHESRGEPVSCQYKVAHVVKNRVTHKFWANSACGVVYEKGQFAWVRHKPKIRDRVAYQKAVEIAKNVFYKRVSDTTHGATFFSTGYRFKNTRMVSSCGNHKFYRLL